MVKVPIGLVKRLDIEVDINAIGLCNSGFAAGYIVKWVIVKRSIKIRTEVF